MEALGNFAEQIRSFIHGNVYFFNEIYYHNLELDKNKRLQFDTVKYNNNLLIDVFVNLLLSGEFLVNSKQFSDIINSLKQEISEKDGEVFALFWGEIFDKFALYDDLIVVRESQDIPLGNLHSPQFFFPTGSTQVEKEFEIEIKYICWALVLLIHDNNLSADILKLELFSNMYIEISDNYKNIFKTSILLLDIALLFFKKIEYTIYKSNGHHKSYDYQDKIVKSIGLQDFNSQIFGELFHNSLLLRYGPLNEDDIDLIRKKEKTQRNVYNYLLLAQFYKDTLQNDKEIEKIICEVEINPIIEEKVKKRVVLYLSNIQLSALARKNDYEAGKSLYQRIKTIQSDNKIINYFLHYKYLYILENTINNRFEDIKNNYDLLISLLAEYKLVLLNYKNDIHLWGQDFNIVSDFILPIKECLFEIDSTPILLQSKYSFPRNLDKIRKDYEKAEYKYNILESQIEQLKRISDITTDFQSKIESQLKTTNQRVDESIDNSKKEANIQIEHIKSEHKSADKRSIEIITLFSAIVMFVAGDIQLLNGVEDMRMAISLILAFGFSLSIFIGLIMLLIGNMESRIQCKDFRSFKYKHAYFIYLILGLIGILCFGFIF